MLALSLNLSLVVISVTSPNFNSSLQAAGVSEIVGLWRTQKGELIRFFSCGSQICGRIVKARSSRGRDTNNPKPHLRKRPVKGLTIIRSNRKTGPKKWTGTVYNVEDGKTYRGSLKLISGKKAELKGCMSQGLCQSALWKKVSN